MVLEGKYILDIRELSPGDVMSNRTNYSLHCHLQIHYFCQSSCNVYTRWCDPVVKQRGALATERTCLHRLYLSICVPHEYQHHAWHIHVTHYDVWLCCRRTCQTDNMETLSTAKAKCEITSSLYIPTHRSPGGAIIRDVKQTT